MARISFGFFSQPIKVAETSSADAAIFPLRLSSIKETQRGNGVEMIANPALIYSYNLLGTASTKAGVDSKSVNPTHACSANFHESFGASRP